ncbi:MAG: lipoprotein-releasing ABC transporter permease subunit [Burkholderiales bacterium]|nr:lipoprotein-releasing ABC transporter permease subunit [Burkholderiales bacterium]
MFNFFEITIGLRYLRAKQKSSFISFISLVSILGIALGVAALITVLSVMNGFQREIRSKIIGVSSHMQLMDASGMLNNWQQIANKAAAANKQILNYAPYIDGQALVSFDNNVSGVLVRGILPQFENKVENVNQSMVKGSVESLESGKFNVVIGQGLARELGVEVGQKITLITPSGQITPAGMVPRLKQFTVSGIFSVHMYEYDNGLVLINLSDAQILFKTNAAVSGIRLKVDDVMDTQKIKYALEDYLPQNIIITDWIEQHQNYFAAVDLEKKMMFVILTLIVAVAAFNLVSTLVMTVNDKKSDIAILRTMGASKRNIMHIFMIQGGISGIIGTVSGTILGLILASNVGKVVHFFEQLTGAKLVNADVYLIDYLPSQIIPHDVISIFLVSIALSIVATLYPSWSASRTDPVEALRYE